MHEPGEFDALLRQRRAHPVGDDQERSDLLEAGAETLAARAAQPRRPGWFSKVESRARVSESKLSRTELICTGDTA